MTNVTQNLPDAKILQERLDETNRDIDLLITEFNEEAPASGHIEPVVDLLQQFFSTEENKPDPGQKLSYQTFNPDFISSLVFSTTRMMLFIVRLQELRDNREMLSLKIQVANLSK